MLTGLQARPQPAVNHVLPQVRDARAGVALRPCSTASNPRIRAHVLLCLLALPLARVAERRTACWRRTEIELSRLHGVTLTSSAGIVVQTTPLTEVQAGLLRDFQVTPPGHDPAPA